MSDDGNVIDIRSIRSKRSNATDQNFDAASLETMDEFRQLMAKYKAVSFAAVAITEHGEVLDTWFTPMPNPALIGAIEIMKVDFIQAHREHSEEV